MIAPRSNWPGIAAMVASTGLFIFSDTLMKMVAQGLPQFQVLFMRSLFGFVSCLVLVTLLGQLRALPGALHWRALIRGLCEAAGSFFYMAAIIKMPIADVIAIGQTAPLLVIVALAVIFRERIGAMRLLLVCAGFLGAVMVAQPGGSGLSTAVIFAFLTPIMVATRDLVARDIPLKTPPFVVILMTALILTLSTGVAASSQTWVAPGLQQWLIMALSGLIVTFGQIAIFVSYRQAQSSVVAPFYYSFTIWAVSAGILVWGEVPDSLAIAGMTLIVLSGVALLFARQRVVREAVA